MQWRRTLFFVGAGMAQIWLGATLFLSLFVAPLVFTAFPVEIAADVMGRLFTPYGWVLVVAIFCAFIGFLALAPVKARCGLFTYRFGIATMGLAWIAALSELFYFFPRSRALREIVKAGRSSGNLDAIADQAAEMMRLHGLSVAVNNFLIVTAVIAAVLYLRAVAKCGDVKPW